MHFFTFVKEPLNLILHKELEKAVKNNHALSAVLLTVDSKTVITSVTFKSFLKNLKSVPNANYISWLSHNKIVLILPNTDQKKALEIGNQIKDLIEALSSIKNKKISISIGISNYHTPDPNGLEVFIDSNARSAVI